MYPMLLRRYAELSIFLLRDIRNMGARQPLYHLISRALFKCSLQQLTERMQVILVYGLQQTAGTDIDTDDDCVEDLPIGTVIDAVGYGYGYEADDCITYYGAVPVGPDGSYDPAGGARCCDCDGNWFMICLNGTEPTGTGCALPDYEVGYATPGGPNDCLGVSGVEEGSWGNIKALYR